MVRELFSEGSLCVPDPNIFGGSVKLFKAGDKEWIDRQQQETMRKTPTIGISTWVYFWRPLPEVLNDIAKAGYSCVEIWGDETHLDPRISPDLSVFKDLLNSLHLRVHSLHAPWYNLHYR